MNIIAIIFVAISIFGATIWGYELLQLSLGKEPRKPTVVLAYLISFLFFLTGALRAIQDF